MPRIARIVIPGCPHHVTQRGNHGQRVFFEDRDYRVYLDLMDKYFRRYKVDLVGFSLMPNHAHHIDIPQMEDSLAKGVGLLHNDFARWQQIQRNLVGHLWQNRFYSNPMDDDHFWMALRYVELNPVRAGLVRYAWDWPYSSASAHITGKDKSGLLNMDIWRRRFDEHQWKAFLLEGFEQDDEIGRIRLATRTGRPLGSKDFIRQLEEITGRSLSPKRRGPQSGSKSKTRS